MNRLRNWMREHPEEGSLSAYFVLLAVVLMGVVGLVVDSSGKYREVERAQLVASGASRSAVNAVTGTAQDNGSVAINSIAARTAAENYIAASGLTGTVTVDGDVVTVTVESSYDTRFISLLGVNQLPAQATSSAQLITN